MRSNRRGIDGLTKRFGGVPAWSLLALAALLVVVAGIVLVTQAPKQAAAPKVPIQHTLGTQTPGTQTPGTQTPGTLQAAFIGDSYTSGVGGTQGGFVPLVARAQGWTPHNFGQGGTGFLTKPDQDPSFATLECGADYCDSYDEVIARVVASAPNIVMVSGGRNNAAADMGDVSAAIDRFFTDLRSQLPNARIIVVSPLWDDDSPPSTLALIASREMDAAAAVSAEWLDIGQPLQGRPDLIAADGVHPNDAGYQVIADSITAALAR